MSRIRNDKADKVIARAAPHLAPVTYIVRLHGGIAVALEHYAMEAGFNAETIIAEAVRAYIGDAE